MSKFNLKNHKKTPGDEHIDRRLQESHKDAPDQINEAQLEDYRASSEPDVLVEKLLENKRLGGAEEITEKRLSDHKAKFANKYRNPKTYDGDINKLEEKRLKNDPVEKEEYKAASECPKQMRWWENVKSPDGLKVSKEVEKVVKTAQAYDPDEIEMDMEEEVPDFDIIDEDKLVEQIAEEPLVEETPSRAISESDAEKMEIIKWKELPNLKKPYLSGIYAVLSYDSIVFGGDEERIKQAALHKVIDVNESLSGKISSDDFYDIREQGDQGTIRFRAVGEDFAPPPPMDKVVPSAPSTFIGEGIYSEVGYQEKDIDGTPMAMGTVIITKDLTPEDLTPENIDKIKRETVDFIKGRHPHLQVNEDSLDLADLESKGEIGYVVGVMPPDNFPVVEASSKKNER